LFSFASAICSGLPLFSMRGFNLASKSLSVLGMGCGLIIPPFATRNKRMVRAKGGMCRVTGTLGGGTRARQRRQRKAMRGATVSGTASSSCRSLSSLSKRDGMLLLFLALPQKPGSICVVLAHPCGGVYANERWIERGFWRVSPLCVTSRYLLLFFCAMHTRQLLGQLHPMAEYYWRKPSTRRTVGSAFRPVTHTQLLAQKPFPQFHACPPPRNPLVHGRCPNDTRDRRGIAARKAVQKAGR
jgi:hypothetical protein